MGIDIINRGSVWNKWDFHVHTPFSFTHQFEGNFSKPDSEEFNKSFDEYVIQLFTRAIDNEISAIGITDYFRIDGYAKLKKDYLDNQDKLLKIFKNPDVVSKINNIYVFPNIELRLNYFVGKNAENLDFHVLFSKSIPIDIIQLNFINNIKFPFDSSRSNVEGKSISTVNVEAYGKKLKKEQGFNGDDLTVGYQHISLDIENIIETLQNNNEFKNKYLTVFDDDNLGQIPWDSRDHGIRKEIVKCSDLQFSNNNSNIEWGLGYKGNPDESRETNQKNFIREFGKLIPSITGSDAHCYDSMFNSTKKLNCWIKANTDFDGLRQIIFEPEDRVKIQISKPDDKSNDKIIDRIEFNDDKFQKQSIYFNDNLNCIIGGKSTGKSILLREIAKTIDKDQVFSREKEASYNRKEFIVNNTRVFWKDGTEDHTNKKIVYIPQTYLNRLIDQEQETTQIDQLIVNVLFQNPNIKSAHEKLNQSISVQKQLISKTIIELTTLLKNRYELNDKLRENGTSIAVDNVIKEINKQIEDMASKSNISTDIISKYNKDISLVKEITTRRQNILSDKNIFCNIQIENQIMSILRSYSNQLFTTIAKDKYKVFCDDLENRLQKDFNNFNTIISSDLDKELELLNVQEKTIRQEIVDLKPIVDNAEEIKILTEKLNIQTQRKTNAQRIEHNNDINNNTLESTLKELFNIFRKYKTIYSDYIETIKNETSTAKNGSMSFSANLIFRRNAFVQNVVSMFDQRTLISNDDKMLKNNLDSILEENFDYQIQYRLFNEMMSRKIVATKNNSFEKICRELFADWYNIDYTINMGSDDVKSMSPGKKSLVLLRLLIEMAQSDSPILIDQPEDDLDNRSIYDDIVKFIKSKKKKRQIIIVTHNANIVLGSDSEEVIIANQSGEDCPNNSTRFEYRSGAIEDNRNLYENDGTQRKGVLNETGIRDQICTILEGGSTAFSLRENKYSLIK